MPVDKKPGESKNDFISRCVKIEINNGHPQDQAVAICISKWEELSNEYPIVELTIDKDSNAGVDALSLVESPAIELDFLTFNKEQPMFKFTKEYALASIDNEKRIITGPALITDKLIYRLDENKKPYYVFFSSNTIEQIASDYLIKHKQQNVTIDHEYAVEDISLIESWIVKDNTNDKSNALGYNVPNGSWFVSMKVNNEDVWNNLIKTGSVKGISCEGSFVSKYIQNSKVFNEKELDFDELLEKIKDILTNITE